MSPTPTVSVLITVYNRGQYLADAVRSVLQSTYTDYEVIIVDDGSQDDSVEIAEEFVAKDSRVCLYINEENLGDYANRNKAASYASGRYLKYLDADDIIYPHSLQIMVDAMDRYPEAGLALACEKVPGDPPCPQKFSPREAYRSFFLGHNILKSGPSDAIIDRAGFVEIGGFSGRQYVGDTELWLKLAAQAPVVKLQPALTWWRRHEGQQMRSEMRDPEVLRVRYQLKMRMLDEADGLLSPVEREKARRTLTNQYARRLWHIAVRQRQPKTALKMSRKSGLSLRDLIQALLLN